MKKGLGFFLGFAILISVVLRLINQRSTSDIIIQTQTVDLGQFVRMTTSGDFTKIKLQRDDTLLGYQLVGTSTILQSLTVRKTIYGTAFNLFVSSKPADSSLSDLGISFTGSTSVIVEESDSNAFGKFFRDQILPIVLFLLIFGLLMKFFGPKGGMGSFPFKMSIGKLSVKKDNKTTFEDVAGMEEVKAELVEIVDYLKNPDKYLAVGAKIPKGVLLYGGPGSGKTLLARAVAGEADVPFFSASGSEFMEMLVGMGAAKVRELFGKAKAASPSIIFIDEIDAIGKRRGNGHTGGHQEQEQTLNQILTEMDGFDQGSKVIVIAATNRPDILDPALLRSGRFDRKVMVGTPTVEERTLIIQYYLSNKKVSDDIIYTSIAKRMSGMVGADIENVINEAALKVAREDRDTITMRDIDYGLEKVLMGPEKKIKTLKEKERKTVIYHELGHAICAYHLKNCDPVEKISIVSRGMALGVTWMMPAEDSYLISRDKYLDDLVALLGGRASEEVFFGTGEITTGASNDFEKVTRIARDMMTKYGMDDELGTLQYMDNEYTGQKSHSEQTAHIIDTKVRLLISSCYIKAKELITTHRELIQHIAQVLDVTEQLDRAEFESLMSATKEELSDRSDGIKRAHTQREEEILALATSKLQQKTSGKKFDELIKKVR